MILVDSNAVAHQVKHAIGNLSWNEKKVGVIFGFLAQILSLAKVFDTNRFVFTWDSRESLRTKLFPDYKRARRREKTAEEKELDAIAYHQFDILRKEIIPSLGFSNSFMIDGYEADDLIASITFTNPTVEFFIISSDEDLYQLLTDKVKMYSTKKKQLYTNKNLWKEYGITPEDWTEVKAIAGCTTDSVPGVVGVGPKTACDYINHRLAPVRKGYKSIRENRELIERNRKLVTLPFEGTPEIRLSVKNNLSLPVFQDVCNEYGFASFLSKDKYKEWKEFVFNK